jgi:hypothetical protein
VSEVWHQHIETTKGHIMTKQSAKLPSHRVFAVTKEGKQKYWRAIGAAWAHEDSDDFSLKLDYLALSSTPFCGCVLDILVPTFLLR